MSKLVEIIAIVEGKTEQIFIQDILVSHFCKKNIYITPIIASKPGQKGGDIKWARVKNDIERFLKQRSDTYLTLFLDLYGINPDWPGYEEAKLKKYSFEKAASINTATIEEVKKLFGDYTAQNRFIPFVAIHEFEALLFSDSRSLAKSLKVSESKVLRIIDECGSPEEINDSQQTAPSKRLLELSKRFKKTTTGISVAKEIGLELMRKKCPIFNIWLENIENLVG